MEERKIEMPMELHTEAKRKTFMDALGKGLYAGKNVDGENIRVGIDEDGMSIRTEQENGWVRMDYFDSEGESEGSEYDGRWRYLHPDTDSYTV